MRGDPPAAALRLASSLPVVTHRAPEPVHPTTAAMRKRRMYGKVSEHTGQPKPIRIGKRRYPSITDARKQLHIALQTIYKMLAVGSAEYL